MAFNAVAASSTAVRLHAASHIGFWTPDARGINISRAVSQVVGPNFFYAEVKFDVVW